MDYDISQNYNSRYGNQRQPQPNDLSFGPGFQDPYYVPMNYAQPQPQVIGHSITTTTIQEPTDWLLEAFCVTCCCFCPTGLMAILTSLSMRSAWANGDFVRAERYSRISRYLIIISFTIGLVSFFALFSRMAFHTVRIVTVTKYTNATQDTNTTHVQS